VSTDRVVAAQALRRMGSRQSGTGPGIQFVTFISHASADDKFVQKLRTQLEESGLSVWVDSRKLRGGDKLAGDRECYRLSTTRNCRAQSKDDQFIVGAPLDSAAIVARTESVVQHKS